MIVFTADSIKSMVHLLLNNTHNDSILFNDGVCLHQVIDIKLVEGDFEVNGFFKTCTLGFDIKLSGNLDVSIRIKDDDYIILPYESTIKENLDFGICPSTSRYYF